MNILQANGIFASLKHSSSPISDGKIQVSPTIETIGLCREVGIEAKWIGLGPSLKSIG